MNPLLERPDPAEPTTEVIARPAADLDDPRVLQALEEYQAALDAGLCPGRADFLARYADVAGALAECLDGLDLVRSAASDLHPAPAVAIAVPAVLGDFRILREVGRGGMGVVYEAEQISLGRRVALKVLPAAAALDDRQRRRFENEARAAAHLQHPNVVPVFAVGTEGGVPYYAMPLIDGPTLAQVIDHLRLVRSRDAKPGARTRTAPTERPGRTGTASAATTDRPDDAPTREFSSAPYEAAGLMTRGADYCRAAARLAVRAAEGLAHAHEQGVVHRDVKPSNLLLDARGQVWVADFGLALVSGDVRLTRTGDVVGTLRYLIPEQARGVPADHRSDVYALGATLYELLTLEPAFPGEDRNALLWKIGTEAPRPPRRLEPALPRDLETVVLKALAKDPAERYDTVRDFADDLRRFLDGRPILAKRPGLTDRALKWSLRHRALVTTAAAGLLLALGALTFGLVREARIRRQEAETARDLRDAVDTMYVLLADRWLYRQPHLEPVQRDVLEKALAYYQRFLRRYEGDPSVRLEAANAFRRVGDIRQKLGQFHAEDAYAEATNLYEGLPEIGRDREARHELAVCWNNRGNLRQGTGRLTEAAEAYQHARRLFADLAHECDSDVAWDGLAGSSINLGTVLHRLDHVKEAETVYGDALAILRRLTETHADVPAYLHDRAACETDLANLLRDTGRLDEAEPLYRAAHERQASLVRRMPSEPLYRQAQGVSAHGLGLLLAAKGRLSEATETLTEASELRARLAADFPHVAAYRLELGATLHALGEVQARRGQDEAARLSRERARIVDETGRP